MAALAYVEKEHEQVHIDVPAIVREVVPADCQIVTTLEELAALPKSSPRGIATSIRRDLGAGVQKLPTILRHWGVRRAIQTLERAGRQHRFPRTADIAASTAEAIRLARHTNPPSYEVATLMAPGWVGPNDYIKEVARRLEVPAIFARYFDELRLRGRLEHEGQALYGMAIRRNAPTLGYGHSLGGPRHIKSLHMLQDDGLDDIIKALVLVAPICN